MSGDDDASVASKDKLAPASLSKKKINLDPREMEAIFQIEILDNSILEKVFWSFYIHCLKVSMSFQIRKIIKTTADMSVFRTKLDILVSVW